MILTGVLDDGTAGLKAVKMRGGVVVIQDPNDAIYAGMPRSAIENVEDIDYVLPLAEIPSVLVKLANTPIEEAENFLSNEIEFESDIAELDMEAVDSDSRPGKPSAFSCPECGGTLWELQEGDLLRFRCRTGHAYSTETLLAEQSDALEDALWIALRALKEKSSLAHRMAKRMRDRNQILSAERLQQEAQDCDERAAVIREVLLNSNRHSVTELNETPALQNQEAINDE